MKQEDIPGGVDIVKSLNLTGHIIPRIVDGVRTKWVQQLLNALWANWEDHFCPWVGGMVGYTRYKFFLQFVTYTGIFCAFVVVSLAIVRSLPSEKFH